MSAVSASDGAPPPPDDVEDAATHARVLALLAAHGAAFGTLVHAPTRTSDESARVRGVALATGAKAMLLVSPKPLAHGGQYVLAVLSAARAAEWGALRRAIGAKQLRLAPVDDVRRLTGCVPGAVPPFGSLWPGVRTVVDDSVLEQGAEINFNSGLRTHSVLGLSVESYLAIEAPLRARFSAAPAAAAAEAGADE